MVKAFIDNRDIQFEGSENVVETIKKVLSAKQFLHNTADYALYGVVAPGIQKVSGEIANTKQKLTELKKDKMLVFRLIQAYKQYKALKGRLNDLTDRQTTLIDEKVDLDQEAEWNSKSFGLPQKKQVLEGLGFVEVESGKEGIRLENTTPDDILMSSMEELLVQLGTEIEAHKQQIDKTYAYLVDGEGASNINEQNNEGM